LNVLSYFTRLTLPRITINVTQCAGRKCTSKKMTVMKTRNLLTLYEIFTWVNIDFVNARIANRITVADRLCKWE